MKIINKIKDFFRKETVLCVALLLAVISSFVIIPDAKYIEYIDFRTLGILFCLMLVMAGLRKEMIFDKAARTLISKASSDMVLALILVMLCFFLSMLITNDVALITFVPLTITVMGMLDETIRKKWLVPVVAMQTVAANLGSMLTPLGNPQNLYLYEKAGLSFGGFINLMLPYATISFWGIVLWNIIHTKKRVEVNILIGDDNNTICKKNVIAYCIMFAVSLLTVIHIIPYYITLLFCVIVVAIIDRDVFTKVDYSLLVTFIGFFVFIGNMGRIEWFCKLISSVVDKREIAMSIVCSQVISNVPAAILLSGFTCEYADLIIGTNIGGLGTLIASMASLISYKYIIKDCKEMKSEYFKTFTVSNIIFLIVLCCFVVAIG